ncbi:MAG TPA: hypothetical protein VGH71_00285 [Gammaproteobacteria bacterium]|jgi:hypothetical protein
MTALADWDSFYVIVGSAAGALIGLQFVVMTLIAANPPQGVSEGSAAFSTPTVVHFTAVLMLAALVRIPWGSIEPASVLFGVIGLLGTVYALSIARRMSTQTAYQPVLEDWIFHALLPLAAYAALAVSAFAAPAHTREALFGVGAAVLVLLFAGIHNAWDSVAYHVVVNLGGKRGKRR